MKTPLTKRIGLGVLGCFGALVALGFLSVFVYYPIIGLFTGNLYLTDRYGAHPVTLHGLTARILSGISLICVALAIWGIGKGSQKYRAQKRLPPETNTPNG